MNERTEIKLDLQTKNEDVLQDRTITFNTNKNEYYYFSAKHAKTGDTFYVKYYNKNKLYSLGMLELSEKETYDEISYIIYNLESIEGIENILNTEILKLNILDDFDKDFSKRKML